MSQVRTESRESLDARAAALVANAPEIDLDSLAVDAAQELVAAPALNQNAPNLAEAAQQLVAGAPAPAPIEVPPADRIETLDQQIAQVADDLIAGELIDERSVLAGSVGQPPPPPEPAAPLPALEAPPPQVQAPEPPAPFTPAPIEPAPERLSPPPAAPVMRPPMPPAQRRAEAPRKPAPRPTGTLTILGRATLPLLALIAAPLQHRSKAMRDLVGWIALVTLFNASCIWVYVLFFRSAHPPAPPSAPVHASAPVKPDSHGAKDSHSAPSKSSAKPDKKAAKPAAKKPAKKDAKQASGGH